MFQWPLPFVTQCFIQYFYNYPCAEVTAQSSSCFPALHLNYPQRPKPPPGIFVLARLPFLDTSSSVPVLWLWAIVKTRRAGTYHKRLMTSLLPQDRIASILKMVDNLSLLMCLQFITTSTFTVTTQPFLAFNPTIAKCLLTSCHSFLQSIKKWLPTGWAFCFRLFAGNCCSSSFFFFLSTCGKAYFCQVG